MSHCQDLKIKMSPFSEMFDLFACVNHRLANVSLGSTGKKVCLRSLRQVVRVRT